MIRNTVRAAPGLSRTISPARIHRALLQAVFLTMALLVAGSVSVFVLGQDGNWDLQNYHFYNAWAFVNGRMGWDLAPAQLQTFHNPLLELPFYAMVAAGWSPRWISAVMALPAGVGAFVLGKVMLLLFADLPRREQWLYALLSFAVGVSATGPVSLLASTINEWQGAMLLTIALWLILRRASEAAIGWRSLVGAGLLAGIASGLKLTAASCALGLCIALLLRPPIARRGIREASVFALAVASGVALSLGPWMWKLYTHFASPLFPYFNDYLRSPWWDAAPLIKRVFGPHTLYEWLTFPLRPLRTEASFFSELAFRDWRLPLLYLVACAVALGWLARRGSRHPGADTTTTASAWRLLLVFWIVSFLVWAVLHSIYRYLLPLELFCGAITIHLLRSGLARRWVPAAAILYAALAIFTVRYLDWWHVDYGERYFLVDVPPVAPRAVVLLLTDAPMAYVLPFFPADGRFLGAKNNLNRPGRHNLLEANVARIIREHDGPLYSLAFPAGTGGDVLLAHGLRVRQPAPDCANVTTNLSTSPLQLCRLQRLETAAAPLRQ